VVVKGAFLLKSNLEKHPGRDKRASPYHRFLSGQPLAALAGLLALVIGGGYVLTIYQLTLFPT